MTIFEIYDQSYQKIKKIRKVKTFLKLQNKTISVGFLFALLAAAFSALPNVIPKSLMDENPVDASIIPNPMMLVFVIYVINSLLFSPIRRKKIKNDVRTKKTTWILLILLGAVEASGTLSYTIGLQETSATNASILINSETIFAILIGIMIFKEKLSRQEMLPFILIIVGSIFIPVGMDIQENNWSVSDFYGWRHVYYFIRIFLLS